MSLTLYIPPGTWVDPDVFLCFVALEEKRLGFDVKVAGPEEAARHAIAARLPAVAHGEHWISEGIAVAEFLAETFPFPHHPRLFPADFVQRARCRQLMLWPRLALRTLYAERPAGGPVEPGAPLPPLSRAAGLEAQSLVQAAEALIPEGRTTAFDAWCIADADFGFTLQRLNLSGHPLPARVRAYAEAQWERPSVRKFFAYPRPA